MANRNAMIETGVLLASLLGGVYSFHHAEELRGRQDASFFAQVGDFVGDQEEIGRILITGGRATDTGMPEGTATSLVEAEALAGLAGFIVGKAIWKSTPVRK